MSEMRFTGMLEAEYIVDRFIGEDLISTMAEFGQYSQHFFGKPPEVSEEKLVEILSETDVALTAWGSPMLPISLLDKKPVRLKYVLNLTGTIKDWIPKEYIEAGIIVSNWGNGPMWYLAEGNLMLMLALSREITRLMRHSLDQPKLSYKYLAPSPTLRRKQIGFVGMGAVGRMLVDLLKPIGCEIIVYDPYAKALPDGVKACETIEQLFEEADVITIQCGWSKETEGMIGRDLLDRLKPHSIFINTARGKIIRQNELIEFLQSRPDVFAGLDVFDTEPLPTDSPLMHMDNVLCYPHCVCGGGQDMNREVSAYAAANIRAFCTGGEIGGTISAEQYDRIT